MKAQKRLGRILIMLVIMFAIITPQFSIISESATFHEHRYDASFEDTRIIVVCPEDGSEVASKQGLTFDVIVFFEEAESSVMLGMYHNNKLIDFFPREDYYEKSVIALLSPNSTEVIEFRAMKDTNTTVLLHFEYPITLSESSHPYDPYYEEKIEEDEQEREEERQESDFTTIRTWEMIVWAISIGAGFCMATLIGVLLPRWTKKRAMYFEGDSPTAHIIAFAVPTVLLIIIGSIAGYLSMVSKLSAMNLINVLASIMIVAVYMLVYILFYYRYTTLPEVELIERMWIDELNIIKRQTMPIRWYENNAGEPCAAVPAREIPKQDKYRRKGRDIIVKVLGNYKLPIHKGMEFNGTQTLVVQDWWFKPEETTKEDVLHPEDIEADDTEEDIRKKIFGRGPKKRMVMWIKPSPIIVKGKGHILMLWDFFMKEQHIEEVNNLRNSNMKFQQFFDYVKMHKMSEWVHLVAGLNFENLPVAASFQDVMDLGKREMEKVAERKQKLARKPAKKKEAKDGSRWEHG